MTQKLIIFSVIIAMMTANAQAAYLSDVQGAVLVNNQAVTTSVEVAPGDRVKVVSGSVNIVYSNGAIVPVAPGQTLVVLANPPGAPAPATAADSGESNVWQPALYVGGGLAVAAGVGLALELSQNSKPASP